MQTPDLTTDNIETYLAEQSAKDMLRFITCGSVDDGKSTLIGRLLYESKLIFDDQLSALEADSKRVGTQGGNIDFALLVDGLAAEREQGITIDVAYRAFTTPNRKFIVADTPGHEQYTRNMATGASTADLAVLLVDATKGILTQTRRHAYIVTLLGIRQLVLAVNKMDLVENDEATYRAIEKDFLTFAKEIGAGDVTCIPMSALTGCNVTEKGPETSWYDGPCLLQHLETVDMLQHDHDQPARLPVQWVCRPDRTFRGFAGTLVSGTLKQGDKVKVLPSARESTIARIVTHDGDLDHAQSGQAIMLTLADEIDASRGNVICSADAPVEVADQFEAQILWMGDEPMLPGRPYLIKLGARTVPAKLAQPKYEVNVNTLEHTAAKTLELNQIGMCNISLDEELPFTSYTDNRDLGGFIIIDRASNTTVGLGLINFALRRASNIHWQALDIHKGTRAATKNQQSTVLWFTGLSGSGKSTVANIVEKRLTAMGHHTYLLDGDNVRHGLNRDLGFTDADRVENIRRVAEVSRLMADAGLIVLVSFISPFRAERRMARDMLEDGEFIEVHVDTPLEVCEARDVKGLYAKARAGEIKNFTGIDSDYEEPENAEITINTAEKSPEITAGEIVEHLENTGRLKPA
ncbi:MAG: sulfate adenylyltransferase subunit CysN [Anderseniella sp.]|nr:sulfate adenylyltransferase subunit CysN [Anderseniella sp.]